ncbi:MAG: hypothetical protein ACT4PL_10180, partial [Phycisphaerales bacterium]
SVTGLLLALVGAGIMLAGFGLALRELLGMYGSALTDPMRETAATDGRAVRDGMLFWVTVGGVGIVPFLVGSYLLKQAAVRRLRAMARRG